MYIPLSFGSFVLAAQVALTLAVPNTNGESNAGPGTGTCHSLVGLGMILMKGP
jgi:hypothetical protein